MEFRPRNYSAENEAHALPRVRAAAHPLSAPPPPLAQVEVVDRGNTNFFDPLRGTDNDSNATSLDHDNMNESVDHQPTKEWTSFRRLLMQRFPVSKMVSVSSMPDVLMRGGKLHDKSSTNMHLEELDDPQKFADEGVKTITWQEYVSRLHELKDEITRSWLAEDRVTSLKLSIKVAKLLMDTSVFEFYPTLFVLVTDIMDMLGNLVWQRIKRKAEFSEDGALCCNLAENFEARDICADAKETCYNWFSKIGAVQELLPRIYLELAILPCWRFLLDQPLDSLQRLVMMTRGLGDPVASAYCRLYMAHCAQKLPSHDIGYLVTCVNDLRVILMQILSAKERTDKNVTLDRKLQVSLMEPTIEYIMKCIFNGLSQRQVNEVLSELGLMKNQQDLGSVSCVSIVLHHLLKELPIEVVSSNIVQILRLIEFSKDNSFDQHMNYRLLGFRLYERKSSVDIVNAVIEKVIQVIALYDSLDEYLKVVDAYTDLILQNQKDNHLNTILEGISKRARNKGVTEDEMLSLQSLVVKLLSHFKHLEDVFSLVQFPEIIDVMYGKSQDVVFLHILNMATSRNGHISDPTSIQMLFEISQTLHDNIEFMNVKDDDGQVAHSISRFVHMVDYGAEMECHLAFLVDCRGAFGRLNELKETLVHSSNSLAIQALKCAKKHLSFVKSCITFSEVTIPSISAHRQFDLFLETAEVALLGGLVSHLDGLIDSAISCLHILDIIDGYRTPTDVEGLVSSIRKLCGFLIMVPGCNFSLPVTYFPNNLFTVVSSQSWFEPKMRTQIFSAIILLLTTLSQKRLPYHANPQIPGNNILYYGDSSYNQELVSLSKPVLENLLSAIQQEPSQAARGIIALEACNCIASSFMLNNELSSVCLTLVETAKSCMSAQDKYLQSTIQLLSKQSPTSVGTMVSISV
ncbi:VPS35 endosomal protein sorting factor-like isoform X2 [Cajanus cajan]|uniref:VPS35 endosomal protein sorting factor-like isoform X2 n=1 Tax=Cajanus cajan TaxID=3821 RepID=UPI00098D89BD|nr:VPS35 endosomal protein sorting factor-like isoform X2 [Cajanus cajan]